jgi:hypothetical protein
VKAIRYARAAGMRVILRPYIDRDDGGWRGQVLPMSADRWFASYTRFVLKFAEIARREKVTGFVVGSEMPSVSRWTSRWRQLIHGVRKRFDGFVTYQANWNEADKVTFWDALDEISISAYYPLTETTDYSTEDLVAGWRAYTNRWGQTFRWIDQIDALRRHYKKPVVFGEIGYRTERGAATKPWETAPIGGRLVSAQTSAYEAALRVWYRVPWFRGFGWWYASPQPRLVSGLPGADHRPTRRALALLGRWYRQAR